MHSGWRVNIPARLLEQSSVGAHAVRIEDKGRLAQCGGRFRRGNWQFSDQAPNALLVIENLRLFGRSKLRVAGVDEAEEPMAQYAGRRNA